MTWKKATEDIFHIIKGAIFAVGMGIYKRFYGLIKLVENT